MHANEHPYPDIDSASGLRHITPSGGTVTSGDGSSIQFPPGAVTSTVIITYTGLAGPSQPLPGGQSALRSFTLEARTSSGQSVTQFAQPLHRVELEQRHAL